MKEDFGRTAPSASAELSALLELAERVEKAEEGSRALDCEIAWAVEWEAPDDFMWRQAYPNNRERWEREGDIRRVASNYKVPSYTTSIDAALTLVPEGWWLTLTHCRTVGCPPVSHAELSHDAATADRDLADDEPFDVRADNCATPALAICAAALKALAATRTAATQAEAVDAHRIPDPSVTP